MAYKFNEKTPFVTIEKETEAGVLVQETVQGIYPFGFNCKLITNENINEEISKGVTYGDFLSQKEEYKDLITETKTKK